MNKNYFIHLFVIKSLDRNDTKMYEMLFKILLIKIVSKKKF